MNIIIINIFLKRGACSMKHMTMVEYEDGSNLRYKVDEWLSENEDKILELLDVEYTQQGKVYMAIITYEERDIE